MIDHDAISDQQDEKANESTSINKGQGTMMNAVFEHTLSVENDIISDNAC